MILRPLAACVLVAMTAASARAAGTELDAFIRQAAPYCQKAPAIQCIDRGISFTDRDGSGTISLAEAQASHRELSTWTQANARRLVPAERERLVGALLVVELVGTERIFTSYDEDADGELTRQELLVDVRLDSRPLPQLLSDPDAVDWSRLTARAGPAAPLLRRLFSL